MMGYKAVVDHTAVDYMVVQRTELAALHKDFVVVVVVAQHTELAAIHRDFVVAAVVVDSDRYT